MAGPGLGWLGPGAALAPDRAQGSGSARGFGPPNGDTPALAFYLLRRVWETEQGPSSQTPSGKGPHDVDVLRWIFEEAHTATRWAGLCLPGARKEHLGSGRESRCRLSCVAGRGTCPWPRRPAAGALAPVSRRTVEAGAGAWRWPFISRRGCGRCLARTRPPFIKPTLLHKQSDGR